MNRESHEWYRKDIKVTLNHFYADEHSGLSVKEAELRLKNYGPNAFREGKPTSFIERIALQLKSPLAFILLAAGIITTLLGEYVDSTVIFIALIINIAISLYQEGRADQAFLRLRASQEKFAVVIRDGEKKRILAETIVLGDLIVLETGMHVPADARIIFANNLEVNESPLTGEWIDVAKTNETINTILPITEQQNMLFMGTLVTGGSGRAIVVRVGNETEIGRIATAFESGGEPRTPLQENVARIARFLSFIILGALIGIFTLGLVRGEPITELLLISIAIAVAAIPEGLPAAVTVVLALGMEAILRRGGLVRNLLGAETLGSTTVILTDKTGTLTKAEMRVARVITLGTLLLSDRHLHGEHNEHEIHGDERDVLQFATLASDAYIEHRGREETSEPPTVHGRPVERAVVLAGLDSLLDQTELLQNYPRIDYLPFESKYRMALSLHRMRGLKHHRIYITGAPELLLEHAQTVYFEGNTHAKSLELKERLERVIKKYAKEGMRLVGVGYRDTTLDEFPKNTLETRTKLIEGLVFAGIVVLHDPLREDVNESIAVAKKAGARVIMATGDNVETARTIALQCGIWKEGDQALTGSDVETMDDEQLIKELKHASVFARMLPEHKLRLVRLLIAEGEVVAMTGDGVNDAPALRAASIGVALGSGTEVAKEASDLILLNNSFSIIVAAIEEGRRIVDNLRKIVVYLLSTSFTEIILVSGALIIGMPIPLLPAQILWTNMLSEGFMNFAFAFEAKEEDVMLRDPKVAGARAMLSKRLVVFICAIGLISGMLLLSVYAYLIGVKEVSAEEARTLIFVLLTLGTTFIAFSLKDLRSSLFKIRIWSNHYLLGSLCFALFGLFLALYVEPLRMMLRLTPFNLQDELPLLVAFVVVNIAMVEVVKYFLFERRKKEDIYGAKKIAHTHHTL